MGAAAILVDFGIVVWLAVDELDRSAKVFENGLVDDTGGAVGAVHADVKIAKVGIAEVVGEMFEVEIGGLGV